MPSSYFLCSFGYDTLIELVGAALGLVGAYFIYLLAIWQIRRDRLKYVALLIEKIVPSAIQQAKYCNDHATRWRDQPFGNNLMSFEPNRDTKRLADKVDQEGLYHAYLWKYGRTNEVYNSFHELYRHIDYVDALIDELIRTNERVLLYTWDRKKDYALTFTKTKELVQTFFVTPDLELVQPKLVAFAGALLEEFEKKHQGGENVEASYKVVIQPLQEYVIKHRQVHQKITELMLLTQEATNKFYGIELSAKHNAGDYNYYALKLEETAVKLTAASMNLSEDFGKPK
jgi:hypothetical protein